MLFCSSAYVKANDARYGLKVASHDPKTLKVLGFQCCFCIAFGREKVGSKQKPTTTVQGWSTPFHYDNIENHMRTQHPTQCAQYTAIKSDNERNNFSPTFTLLSRIPSKRISRLHHWAPSTRSFLISTRTSSIPLLATCCSTL
jgi:hypothetical protein